MTITLTVAGRIATVDATTHVVAGNTYPVTLALDSEWTGNLYLRVRFGGLYYDIPFASSATSVDVQMPVGYPEVGIGVYSEALEICTSEARVRLLRSILEAGSRSWISIPTSTTSGPGRSRHCSRTTHSMRNPRGPSRMRC